MLSVSIRDILGKLKQSNIARSQYATPARIYRMRVFTRQRNKGVRARSRASTAAGTGWGAIEVSYVLSNAGLKYCYSLDLGPRK